ncbi:uncharacterized protein LOC116415797 [Nasonia vitripennis]|uniref:Transmembrane protein n=1 Tax=Nasonia vitripennis TaxID=7425 RepID=A0A7M7T646_NASVI|nr:uncharacterized protein LOC116415797 [Nasonia vitripennis]
MVFNTIKYKNFIIKLNFAVLMALTLCTLRMHFHSHERMVVSSISFICHLIYIQRVHWNIPHNGNIAPNLSFLKKDSSFLIMAFVMILMVLLRELHALKSPTPQWLSSKMSLIQQSKVGQLLLLSILDPKASAFLEVSSDNNDNIVDGGTDDEPKPEVNMHSTWNCVALIVGWFAFILIFFA